VTEQNNPLGQPPQGEQPQQPPQAPPAPAAPAPQIPHQAFGDAPAPQPPAFQPPADPAQPAAAPGDASFGAAPAYPPPAAEGFGTAPAPVKKKSNVVKIVSVIGAVILVICLAGVVFLVRNGLNSDDAKQAKAGDCIGNLPDVAEGEDKEANGAKVVDCTSADALYKVEGRVEDKTEDEAKDESVCAAYPAADSWYRAIPSGGKGYVLCLSAVK
jgi:hypothetical protein